MLRRFYLSSRAAALTGLVLFAISVAAVELLKAPAAIVFAPGRFLGLALSAAGADVDPRFAVLGTFMVWCLIADAVFIVIRKPWVDVARRRALERLTGQKRT